MKDWRTDLNFSMSRQIMTGFIVSPRITGQRRVFGGLALVLILLAPWWLWQQQDTSSLDPIAHGVPLGEQQFGEPIQPFPITITIDPMKAALGSQFFHEPLLSRTNTIPCASCHKLDHGGADGASIARGSGGASGTIDKQTVFNSGLNDLSVSNGSAEMIL
ncbi:MAG: cytochrome-c peroxidase [Nitrospiraceae bacterium]|nr:cytochrome-c peroxidase [Nitrospiraceae bacterium]